MITNKSLANSNRLYDWSMLCLYPKSSLCSYQHCILDMMSFGNADSVHSASNNPRMWRTDGQRQSYDSQDCPHIHCVSKKVPTFSARTHIHEYEYEFECTILSLSVEVGVFRRGWVNLSADFRGKRASPTNHCWCQNTRVIAVSCSIKISTVHPKSFVTIHMSDGQMDGRTDRIATTIPCVTLHAIAR